MKKKSKIKSIQSKPEFTPSFPSTNSNDTENGLYLMNIYLPEEIVLYILSFIDPECLLRYSLVCRMWNKLIKSYSIWSTIYERNYRCKAKKLPWYLYYCLLSTKYFDNNLLLNGNGQDGLKHWQCKVWEGDKYIEESPLGVDFLPSNVPDFNNKSSCFITSYFTGSKSQPIKFGKNKLFRYIFNKYKPHIYLSEWTTGNFDCSCVYELCCGFIGDHNKSSKPTVTHFKRKWENPEWKKVELLVTEYPDRIKGIIFENSGYNTDTWKGHYGIKMAGAVVKLLFNSIEPLPVDKYGNEEPKTFSKVNFISNGPSQAHMSTNLTEEDIWNGEYDDDIYYFMP